MEIKIALSIVADRQGAPVTTPVQIECSSPVTDDQQLTFTWPESPPGEPEIRAIRRVAEEALRRADAVEASYTGRTGFKTCLAFSKMRGYRVERRHLATIGRAISRYCLEHTIPVCEVEDERYDTIRSYPIEVLERHEHLFERFGKPANTLSE
ncbi:hypothetical protein AB1L88_19735 [Tautonia sp. JC769]|uniref:hypothetical protein n=1 Tax=Tautonia sp. JC769 TaxID=3232135 RepID=UPI003458F96E